MYTPSPLSDLPNELLYPPDPDLGKTCRSKDNQKRIKSGLVLSFIIHLNPSYVVCMEGGGIVELHDVLRVAGIGLLIAILHLFFESTGKKEFAFFLFFVGYIYMTIELLRLLKLFFYEISTFLEWLMMTS